jgi:SAM-dependent methyltransferase
MPAVDYEKLARFYDRLVVSDDDVGFFVDVSRQAAGPVIELMAGTGRVSIPVAAAGVPLTCVDSSPAMLSALREKLRRHGLSAEVVEQDVTLLDLDMRFALAFLAFHSFEELTEDDDRIRLLRHVYSHLLPGGTFICTLHDPDVRLRDVGPGRDREWAFEGDDGREVRLRLTSHAESDGSIVRGHETLEDVASGIVLADLPLCFRLTSHDEFRSLVRRTNFAVKGVYGSYRQERYTAGQSASMIWVLARPAALPGPLREVV